MLLFVLIYQNQKLNDFMIKLQEIYVAELGLELLTSDSAVKCTID